MRNRLWLCAPLVLSLAAFTASIYAQAVLPDPSTLAPVINPPNPQTNIVISLGEYLTGHTPFEVMQLALTACQNSSLSVVHKVGANTNNLVFQCGGSVHAFQVDK